MMADPNESIRNSLFLQKTGTFLIGEESADNHISGKLDGLASKEPSVLS